MAKVRRASDSELWIAMQRLWTFEEPASRWIRLRKRLAKLAPNSMSLDAFSIHAQEELFHAAYGTDGELSGLQNDLNVYISCAFALAEIPKFQDTAFSYCRRSELNADHEQLIEDIAQSRNLTVAQASYLRHSVRITPDWRRLSVHGPWDGDERAKFVGSVLDAARSEFARNTEKNAEGAGITGGDHFRRFSLVNDCFVQRECEKRAKLPSGFLPRRIILVEGVTEQILLPHFAQCVSEKWNEKVFLVIPAGGANQVARRYPGLREITKLPIDCLLDGDVLSQAASLSAQLKNGDKLYVLKNGAIEEAFAREQIIEMANSYFDGLGGAIYSPVTLQDLTAPTNQESLDRLWRKRNRGSFDKTGFAKVVAEKITRPAEIPPEIRQLIDDLCVEK